MTFRLSPSLVRKTLIAGAAALMIAAAPVVAADGKHSTAPTCDARVTTVALGTTGFPYLGPSHLYIVEDETEVGRNTGHQLLYLESNGVVGLQRNDWMCMRPKSGSDFMVATTGHCEYTRGSRWERPGCPA